MQPFIVTGETERETLALALEVVLHINSENRGFMRGTQRDAAVSMRNRLAFPLGQIDGLDEKLRQVTAEANRQKGKADAGINPK